MKYWSTPMNVFDFTLVAFSLMSGVVTLTGEGGGLGQGARV